MSDEGTLTLGAVAKEAEHRTQALLDAAREGISAAETALGEAARSPLFGNGVERELREMYLTVKKLNDGCQQMKKRVYDYFRREEHPEA